MIVVIERPLFAGTGRAFVLPVAETLGGRFALPRDAAMTIEGGGAIEMLGGWSDSAAMTDRRQIRWSFEPEA